MESRPIRGRMNNIHQKDNNKKNNNYNNNEDDSSQHARELYQELAALYIKWSDEDGQDNETIEIEKSQDISQRPVKEFTYSSSSMSCHSIDEYCRELTTHPKPPILSKSPQNSSTLNQMTFKNGESHYFPQQTSNSRFKKEMTSYQTDLSRTKQPRPLYKRCADSDKSLSLPNPESTPKDQQDRRFCYSQRNNPEQEAAINKCPSIPNTALGDGHYCTLCKKNGETREFYSSHVIKDSKGHVVCPVLRDYVCPLCGATGPKSHTISYCPFIRQKMIRQRQAVNFY